MKAIKRTSAIVLALALILSIFSACSIPFLSPEKKLLGAWRDSTGTMGYEFLDNNLAKITYADFTVPIINIKYNGTVDGTYTLAKNADKAYVLTINYTILTQTISKSYFFNVEGDSLTLTDVEDGTQTVLMKYTETVPSSSAPAESASAQG